MATVISPLLLQMRVEPLSSARFTDVRHTLMGKKTKLEPLQLTRSFLPFSERKSKELLNAFCVQVLESAILITNFKLWITCDQV